MCVVSDFAYYCHHVEIRTQFASGISKTTPLHHITTYHRAERSMALRQEDYELLMRLEKVFEDPFSPLPLGPRPMSWTRKIMSPRRNERFFLNYFASGIRFSRYTFNHRYRQTVVLLRYDNDGRHTNPDGQTLTGPHVHLYREGFDDKFAFPMTEIGVVMDDTPDRVVAKILHFCAITSYPEIQISRE